METVYYLRPSLYISNRLSQGEEGAGRGEEEEFIGKTESDNFNTPKKVWACIGVHECRLSCSIRHQESPHQSSEVKVDTMSGLSPWLQLPLFR